jgi:F-type H+-transporting ATPase subunit b
MPQLQPNDFAPQLFWLLITFTLLYLALSRVALPRIEKVLGTRSGRVADDRNGARQAQQESEKAMQRYEGELEGAKSKGQGILRAHRERLDRELAEKRSDLDRRIGEKNAATETTVQALLDKAKGDMEAITSTVVGDIVKSLSGIDANADEVKNAIRKQVKG